jgi:glutamyl-tRNA(Gln) amidotransferase subunit E
VGHGRVEIKGVQKISLIASSLEYEKKRHLILVEISSKLRSRYDPERVSFTDVSKLFTKTKSKTIISGMKANKKVYASVLPGMKGYLKKGNFRLGLEIADVARLYGAGGILHSDELPGYGIDSELKALSELLDLRDDDAFAILVCDEDKIQIISQEIRERITRLLNLELSETRFVDDDGVTHYLRPLPGRERMYPETDIDVINLTHALISECNEMIPKTEEQIVNEFVRAYGISRQDALSILNKGLVDPFKELTGIISDPRLSSRILNQLLPELSRRLGIKISPRSMLDAVSGCISAGIQPSVIESALSKHFTDGTSFDDLSNMPGLQVLSRITLKKIIQDLLVSEQDTTIKNLIPRIRAKVEGAFDPKMAMEIYWELVGHS